jgi:hypothetical protein
MSDKIAATIRPEREVAEDLKRRMTEALVPVLALMNEASRQGMLLQWDGLGPNQFGQNVVHGLRVVKVL